MNAQTWTWGLALTMCFAVSGCGLTLGPTVKTEYVVVHPGRPMEVLEQTVVEGRVLDGTGETVRQDIGGWVIMPPDHWKVVKAKLEEKK